MKQSELAALLGRASSVISNGENDAHNPDVAIVRKLCLSLNITPNILCDRGDASGPAAFARERAVHDMFRQLNEEGQKMVISNAEGLVATGKYKKGYFAETLAKEAADAKQGKEIA